MIQQLLDGGHAYLAEEDDGSTSIYYRVGVLRALRRAGQSLEGRRSRPEAAVASRPTSTRRRTSATSRSGRAGLQATATCSGSRPSTVDGEASGREGASRVAHRVLRDVVGAPRRADRHPPRRRGPALSAPPERDRPERGRHGEAPVRPLLDAPPPPARGRREDVEEPRQLLHARGSRRGGGPCRGARLPLPGGLGALPHAHRLLLGGPRGGDARRCATSTTRGSVSRRPPATPTPNDFAAEAEAAFRAAMDDDLETSRRHGRRPRAGGRGEPPQQAGALAAADAACALGCSGWPATCWAWGSAPTPAR